MSTIRADNISPVGSTLNLTAPVAGLSVAGGLTVGGIAFFSGGVTFNSTTNFTGLVTLTGGATSAAVISCATAPTQGQHLANKTYVDSLMWTSSSTATIPIGGIVMTGAQSGEGNGVDNGGGGTINTTSIGPGYIIYAITYAANSGNNKLGGRYWIGARTQAQINADTVGGYTGTPTVIYGTFVCRGVAERAGTNVVPYLWQRIA